MLRTEQCCCRWEIKMILIIKGNLIYTLYAVKNYSGWSLAKTVKVKLFVFLTKI